MKKSPTWARHVAWLTLVCLCLGVGFTSEARADAYAWQGLGNSNYWHDTTGNWPRPLNWYDPQIYYPGYLALTDTALFGPSGQRSNVVINDRLAVTRIDYTAPGYALTANANVIITEGISATYDNAPNLAVNGYLYLGGTSTVKNLTGTGLISAFDNKPTNLAAVGPAGDFGGILSDSESGAYADRRLSLTVGDGTHAASLTLRPNGSYYFHSSNNYSGTTLVNANATLASTSGTLSGSSPHVINGTLTLASGSAAVASLSGTGTVNLGANTLTVNNGGTFGGSVTGAGNLRVAGGRLALDGASVSNAIQLTGGSLARELPAGSNLAGALDVISADGPEQTGAEILSGTTTSATTLEASFDATPATTATNDDARLSDVLSLHGTGTDTFTLQLSAEGVTAGSYLGWFDAASGRWVNAVDGNTGGVSHFVQGAWQAGYGVDTTNDTVWAVINHNSDFAVVPEPGAAMFMLATLGGLALRRRRRQRA